MKRIPMHMKDWIAKLHGFLTLNDREILTHSGRVSHATAIDKAEREYDKYNKTRVGSDNRSVEQLEAAVKLISPKK
jgi:hypothetical protein